MLQAERLCRTFHGTKGPIEVLRGADLSAEEGEIVVILGASGAGKSTLLHLLGTLDLPDEGRVLIRGMDPRECSERELNRIRNRDLGFVFQFHYLLPEFTAFENVMMPSLLRGADQEEAGKRAVRLLTDVGLAERMSHRPAELSGGEQQRVAVARALVNEPAIVLADEPSGNLDDRNSEGLHSLIAELSRSKKQTFVIVTHKKELLGRADRGLVLEGGILHLFQERHDAVPSM
ncbi:MAG TPA: ABC transporter ATP-binding protein [Patescibacteria group bacterium]|nr:ABC transporter ATP-binding protein [Patescibacteria group bacterium]